MNTSLGLPIECRKHSMGKCMDQIENPALECQKVIYSEEYGDFFIQYRMGQTDLGKDVNAVCVQIINRIYAIAHIRVPDPNEVIRYTNIYSPFPKLYGLMDTSNIENVGVFRIRRQSYLNLLGSGVIIGFVDTGIDYTNAVFRNADNTSRILRIWDQTIPSEDPTERLWYGTEYTREQINEALRSEDPYSIVPSRDENGHGTFMAGIATGNIDESNDFTGVAPLSDIIMVKLKPAKQLFRDYYFVSPNAVSYQETDIILGVRYMIEQANALNRPLVICLGVGTNSGGHDGKGILDEYLDEQSDGFQTCIVLPTGNEANYGLHYQGSISANVQYEDVEIRVGEGETGFTLELWAKAPSLFGVGFISPSGEYIQEIPPRVDSSQIITFLFESTEIYVSYRIIEYRTGDELVFMRFRNPTSGIWKIRVFAEQNFSSTYDMWLPIREFLSADTQFARPDPDITITDPGNTLSPITVAAYNHVTNAIFINSGRGYTRSGRVKPDIAAPGVNVYGPIPGNQFTVRSGTSIAVAHAAGAAALLMEWGVVKGNNPFIDTSDIKSLFIKGARRSLVTYPNRESGYGALDVFGAFESLRTTL